MLVLETKLHRLCQEFKTLDITGILRPLCLFTETESPVVSENSHRLNALAHHIRAN